MDNNVRKTIPEPLMFIHTVSTPITSNGSKTVYDSRYKNTFKKLEKQNEEVVDQLVLKKLESIIKMNELNHLVNCLFETTTNMSIEGIPLLIEEGEVVIKQINGDVKIKLNEIKII